MIIPKKPIKGSPLPKRWWAFDTETKGLFGEVVLICLISNMGEKIHFKGIDCVKEFKQWIRDNNQRLKSNVIYAHNTEFDTSKVFGNIIKSENCYAMFASSRLISLKYSLRKYKTENQYYMYFNDTFNLAPVPLDDIAKSMGMEKGITPQKFIDGTDECYDINRQDIKYCYQDCNIIIKFVEFLGSMFKSFNVKLKKTCGANSKNIWQTKFLDHPINVREKTDEKFRLAYYGGRTEVFTTGYDTKHLYHYDVNSLYPSQMIKPLPDPETLKVLNYTPSLDELNTILKDKEGMIKCKITCPDINLPLLPSHNMGGKLLFPTDDIVGSWCFPEIRLALKLGYQIKEIHEIIISNRIESPFIEYIKTFTEMKISAKKNDKKAIEQFAKRMLNTLYGKFAQMKDDGERYFKITLEQLQASTIEGSFKCINKNLFEKVDIKKVRADDIVVCWSAYISSYARCNLYDYLNYCGDELYYCDTDSVFTTKQLPDDQIDNYKLGMMSLEDECKEFNFVDPKKYSYVDTNDKLVIKFKGIPKKIAEQYIKDVHDINGEELVFEYDKPVKTKTSLKRDILPYSKETIRKIITKHGNPKRSFNYDGTSKPLKNVILNKIDKKDYYTDIDYETYLYEKQRKFDEAVENIIHG